MSKKILILVIGVALIVGGLAALSQRRQPTTTAPPELNGSGVGVHTTPPPESPPPAAAAPAEPDNSGNSVVRFSNPQSKAAFLSANGLNEADLQSVPSLSNTYVVKRAAESLDTTGAVVSEQHTYRALLSPNDPLYPQWYTDKIAAPTAWDTSTGSSTVDVAVIDTGFGLNHEDMANRWAANAGETGGGKESNGVDDDANGFVDDWRGWDFNSNDNNPMAGLTNPSGGAVDHGTITAGLVGATGNNGAGVASVNWAARILPLQALGDNGSGTTDTVAAAIHYAADRGVKVISLSLGSTASDPILQAEINYAISRDVVVVAAAGNCGDPASYTLNGCSSVGQMVYPANYPAVVAVGASDSNDGRASFSSYGANLDLVAPGAGSIRAPDWSNSNQTNLYTNGANGTSFATPIVAGSVATARGLTSLNASQIISALLNGADKVAGMSGANFTSHYGYGRLNIVGLLNQVNIADPCRNASNISGVGAGGNVVATRFGAGQADRLSLTELNNTGSRCAEVHTWADGSLQTWLQNVATNHPALSPADNEIIAADSNGDGRDELFLVKYQQNGSGRVEVHGWDSSFGRWASHIASNHGEVSPADSRVIAADTNGDGRDEFLLVKYQRNGSGRVEVHIWSADLQNWLSHIASNHPDLDPVNTQVIGADSNGDGRDELFLVKNRANGSGQVEVHGWSGDLQEWVSHIASNHPEVDPAYSRVLSADVNGDGRDDFFLVKYRDTGSDRVELHGWTADLQGWLSHIASNKADY